MYDDSFWEIGFDALIGAPVFWRCTQGAIEIVYAFDLVPRVETGAVWIADISTFVFWRLWTAARKEYGNGCV